MDAQEGKQLFLDLWPAIRPWLSGPRARAVVAKKMWQLWRQHGVDLSDCVRPEWPETTAAQEGDSA